MSNERVENSGYSKQMLASVIKYFNIAGNREDAIADGTFDTIKAKVRRSCEVFNEPVPSWAEQ